MTAPLSAVSAALPLDPSTAAAPAATPTTPDQGAQFEALLQRDELATYAAPPPEVASPALQNEWLQHAAESSQRLRDEMQKPVALDEGLTDLEVLQKVMQHNQDFLRVNLEFQYTTKVAELGTQNLQTLYQMQG